MLVGSAAVLAVGDIASAIAYYRDALGFAVTFQYGEPTFYACLCRDEVNVHLISAAEAGRPAGDGAISIFVDDVDGLHAELVARAARILKPPQDYEYGMRDFDVVDADGNRLIFGMSTGKG